MLTGYNTDVSYGGEIFHVQTEDKGIHTPIILSLVYRAGTILAAKRTSYDNFIHDGIVDETAVAQMLSKQHNLLVAAIKSGKSHKLEELSRQYSEQRAKSSGKPGEFQHPPHQQHQNFLPHQNSVSDSVKTQAPKLPAQEPVQAREIRVENQPRPDLTESHLNSVSNKTLFFKPVAPIKVEVVATPPAIESDYKEPELPSFDQIISGYLQSSTTPDRLRIELLYPSRFIAGDEVTVRAAVLYGGHSPASNTVVKLQILGTRIDPQHLTARTDFQGLVGFNVKLPTFACGAAALVLTAKESNGQETEVKYMIRKK